MWPTIGGKDVGLFSGVPWPRYESFDNENCGPNDGDETLVLEPNEGSFGAVDAVALRAEDGVENSFLIAGSDSVRKPVEKDFINETSFLPTPKLPLAALNDALGPSSCDMVSRAPAAAWAALKALPVTGVFELELDLALEMELVLDKSNGEVILCKPGANCAGVDDG